MSEDATLDHFLEESDSSGENINNELDPKILSGIFDGWKKTPLAEVADSREDSFVDGPFGANLLSEEYYEEGFARTIKLQNIRPGQFVDTNKKYITEEKFQDLERHSAYPSEIAIAKMAEPVARACILPDSENQYILAAADVVKLDTGQEFSNIFIMYSLNSHPVWKQAFSRARGTGRKRINLNQLKEVQVPNPPLPEQRKIATVLYAVDRAIQKTEQIIEQLDTLKSGVVQQVFKEGTRDHEAYQTTKSGSVPEGWELARLEEVIADTRYGTDTKSNTESNGYPTLRIPNVVNKRITVDDLKHTPLKEDELERLKLEDGDILVIRTNGNPEYVGRCATFNERDGPFVFASYLIRVRVDESRVRPDYVREFLNSPRGRSEMAGWVRSSAGNYNLSVGAMEKFQIPIPSLEEQDEMVEKITKIEKTIETNRGHRTSLRRLKRGLMQDLLSGTVRTTDTNIEVPEEIAQYG